MSRRTKQILWVTAGILVLAGVIFLGGALSGTDAPPVPTAPSTALKDAETYAGQAAAALASKDTSTAVRLANQALALDGSNKTARQVLQLASDPSASAPAVTEPATVAAAPQRDDSAYLKKVDSLGELLPKTIEGWSAGALSEEGKDALVTFEPTTSIPEYATITRVVFSAHDRKTAAKAKKFVSAVNKKAYPVDGITVQVGVMPKAYFGTNEAGGAVVAFSRGRYAFEVTIVAQESSPGALKATGTTLAGSLPAAR